MSKEKARIKKRVKALAEESWPRTGCTIHVANSKKSLVNSIFVSSSNGTFVLKVVTRGLPSGNEATSILADANGSSE